MTNPVARGVEAPRKEFAARVRELWQYAGNPTLKAVAERGNQNWAAAGGVPGGRLTVGIVASWRSGEHLPALWERAWAALRVLIAAAEQRRDPIPQDRRVLLSRNYWQQLWAAADSWAPSSQCPYPGLRPYGVDDAESFSGRERATSELVELVRSADAAGGGIVALVGASGAGKSSLLAAGLVPTLGDAWPAAIVTPSARSEPPAAPQTRLLVVDQFEELFAAGVSAGQRRGFLDRLTARCGAGGTVVLGLRADFYAPCLEHPVLTEALTDRQYALGSMSAEDTALAVTGPAAQAGLVVEDDLLAVIMDDLGGMEQGADVDRVGALPLLSHVMRSTWQHRSGTRLTAAGYRRSGRLAGAIAATAAEAWNSLDPDQQATAHTMLVGMVNVGQGVPDTRRRVPRTDLQRCSPDPESAMAVLNILAGARLVTVDHESATLAHEAVLQAWPRLREWIDADRGNHLIRQHTESDAADWVASGRSADLLYRGRRLTQAAAAGSRVAAGPAAEFLAASARARHRRRAVAALLACLLVVLPTIAGGVYVNARITERRQQNEALFSDAIDEADRLRNTDPTLSAELTVLASRLHPADGRVRSQLIASQTLPLAATFTDHHGEVTQFHYVGANLLAVAGDDHIIRLWNVATPGIVSAAGPPITDATASITALNSDGPLLLVGSSDHMVRGYDLSDPAHPRRTLTFDSGAPVVDLDLPEDHASVLVGHDHEVTFWALDGAPRRLPVTIPIQDQLFAVATMHGTVVTIELTDPSLTAPSRAVRAWTVNQAAGSADSTTLADSPTLQVLINETNGLMLLAQSTGVRQDTILSFTQFGPTGEPTPLGAPFRLPSQPALQSLALSADGRLLAGITATGTILWNVSDHAHPVVLGSTLTGSTPVCAAQSPDQPCGSTPAIRSGSNGIFSQDGRYFTLLLPDGVLEQWTLPLAERIGDPGPTIPMPEPLSSDGHRMLVGTAGAPADIWDLGNPGAARLVGHITDAEYTVPGSDFVTPPSISDDGRLAMAMVHGVMTLFDISDPSSPRPVHEFSGVLGAAFARDRPALLTLSAAPEAEFTVWDDSHPDQPTPIAGPIVFPQTVRTLDTGIEVTQSRDGRLTALLTDSLQLWDSQHWPLAIRPIGSTDVDWNGAGSGLAVAPDHRTVVAGVDNGLLRVWDTRDPGKITPLGKPVPVGGSVQSVDLSPDGKLLATSGSDCAVRLWNYSDPANLEPIGLPLTTAGTTGWQALFDPSANYLIGIGDTGEVRIWDLDPEHALTRSTITAELTAALPGRHLPELCP